MTRVQAFAFTHAKKFLIVATILTTLLFSVGIAQALGNVPTGGTCTSTSDCASALDDCVSNKCQPSGSTSGDDFGLDYGSDLNLGDNELDDAVVQLINVLLGFLGLIAVVIILIGGFQWMTAAGNDEKVETARKTIFAGVIGIVIIGFAWGISLFVINQVIDASNL